MADLGVSIEVHGRSLEDAQALLQRFVSFDPAPLTEAIAGLGQSQTQHRITDEKTAPDGTPWQPNHVGGDELYASGQHLCKSLAFYASAEEAVWGASWEHAHVHQEGAVITAKNAPYLTFFTGGRFVSKKEVTIPARPFIGISDANRADIEDLVSDYFGRLTGSP